MIGSSSNSNNEDTKREARRFVGWILLAVALFLVVALLTYDWHAISVLQAPAAKSSNWIGALGDGFAYYGYTLIGLGVWSIPLLCVLGGFKSKWTAPKILVYITFIIALSSLIEVVEAHTGMLTGAMERNNLASAGGAIGYLLMTKALCPLLSDFGSSVIMLIILVTSFLTIVGMSSLKAGLVKLFTWAKAGKSERPEEESDPVVDWAKEKEKADREAELAAIREAKEAAKREKLEAKIRAQREKLLAKEAARAEKEAARATTSTNSNATYTDLNRPNSTSDAEGLPNKGPYVLPPKNLLNPLVKSHIDNSGAELTAQRLIDTLKLFGVDAKLSYKVEGPVVTKYAVETAPGTRYSTVTSLFDNLMGALHAKSLRIEAPIPGEDRIGFEVPNMKPVSISFREIFEGEKFQNGHYELPLLFGKDAAGNDLVADLATMPHMLVAGATGQGKSVCLNSIINGLLMTRTPEQLKLIMVDPKSVEFSFYRNIPHLLVPVITDNNKVVKSLQWAVVEMEKRLKLFSKAHVKNIKDFNSRKTFTQPDMFGGQDTAVGSDMPRTVPYIIIIIDEVADLMQAAAKEVTGPISRIAAKARAAGIHLILATQRPDAKVITGTIKANIPGRVAFKTASGIDSRTILDEGGAENLIGRGDMLFRNKEGLLIRAQGAWISDDEITRITEFIEKHSNTQFDEQFARGLSKVKESQVEDPFADQNAEEEAAAAEAKEVKSQKDDQISKAIEVIINTKRASVSHFQRKMGIGYNNAARLCDTLEEMGVIGPQAAGAGPRTILMSEDEMMGLIGGGSDEASLDSPEAPAGALPGIPGGPSLRTSGSASLDQTQQAEPSSDSRGRGLYMAQGDLFYEENEEQA